MSFYSVEKEVAREVENRSKRETPPPGCHRVFIPLDVIGYVLMAMPRTHRENLQSRNFVLDWFLCQNVLRQEFRSSKYHPAILGQNYQFAVYINKGRSPLLLPMDLMMLVSPTACATKEAPKWVVDTIMTTYEYTAEIEKARMLGFDTVAQPDNPRMMISTDQSIQLAYDEGRYVKTVEVQHKKPKKADTTIFELRMKPLLSKMCQEKNRNTL